MGPPKKRSKRAEREWEQHKATIYGMVMEENKSTAETRESLEQRGFSVTKSQLDSMLGKWGFRKKIPKHTSEIAWQYIGYRLTERALQGKASEVLMGGRAFPNDKVRKETTRHQLSTLAKVHQSAFATRPKTPEGVNICIRTPTLSGLSIRSSSTPVQLSWPPSLPWIQFKLKLSQHFSFLNLQSRVDSIIASDQSIVRERELALTQLVWPFHSTIRCNVSRLAAAVGAFMPEAYDQEHMQRSQLLLQGSPDQHSIEYTNILLYKLSNNLLVPSEAEKPLIDWELLEDSGIMKTKLHLRNSKDITVLAIAEKLLQLAFQALLVEFYDENIGSEYTELSSYKVIVWLLSCGQNPNVSIRAMGNQWTLLQGAALCSFHSLTLQLLNLGALINWYHDLALESSLVYAVMEARFQASEDTLGVVQKLLQAGAHVNKVSTFDTSVLMVAIESEPFRRDLVDTLIDGGANLLQRVQQVDRDSESNWFTSERSVLGHAASLPKESVAIEVFTWLWELTQRTHSINSLDLITWDVILLAASRGHNKLLRLLYESGADVIFPGEHGVSALHVAAYYGHSGTCRFLLDHGAHIDGYQHHKLTPSPLYMAAFVGKLDAVKVLHQGGADLDAWIEVQKLDPCLKDVFTNSSVNPEFISTPIGATITIPYRDKVCRYLAQNGAKVPSWVVYYGVCKMKFELVDLALQSGADPNWKGDDGISPLQAALEFAGPATPKEINMRIQMATILLYAGAIVTCNDVQNSMLLGSRSLTQRLRQNMRYGTQKSGDWVAVLHKALILGNCQVLEETHRTCPDAYTPDILCASVIFKHANPGAEVFMKVLQNRPPFTSILPLEVTAIGIAAWHNMAETLELLLTSLQPATSTMAAISYHTDPHNKGRVLRPWNSGREGSIREYLNAKCNGSGVGRSQLIATSPLVFALWSEETLSRLLSYGFRPDKLTMSVAARMGDTSIVEKLMKYSRMPSDAAALMGPLSAAVQIQALETVKILLENGEDINEDNYLVERGRSPLQMAIQMGDLALIDLIMEHQANVNETAAKCSGGTALQLACIEGLLGVSKRLIEAGADVNALGASEHGRTALEGAAEHGRIDIIEFLLRQNVKTTGMGRVQYLRSIMYAQWEGHEVAVKLLKSHRQITDDDINMLAFLSDLSMDECENFTEGLWTKMTLEKHRNTRMSDDEDTLSEDEISNSGEPPQSAEEEDEDTDFLKNNCNDAQVSHTFSNLQTSPKGYAVDDSREEPLASQTAGVSIHDETLQIMQCFNDPFCGYDPDDDQYTRAECQSFRHWSEPLERVELHSCASIDRRQATG